MGSISIDKADQEAELTMKAQLPFCKPSAILTMSHPPLTKICPLVHLGAGPHATSARSTYIQVIFRQVLENKHSQGLQVACLAGGGTRCTTLSLLMLAMGLHGCSSQSPSFAAVGGGESLL